MKRSHLGYLISCIILTSKLVVSCPETSINIDSLKLFANRVYVDGNNQYAIATFYPTISYLTPEYFVEVKSVEKFEGTEDIFAHTKTTYEISQFDKAYHAGTVVKNRTLLQKKTISIQKNIYPNGLTPKSGVPQGTGITNSFDKITDGQVIKSC